MPNISNPPAEGNTSPKYKIVRKRVSSLKPSPENLQLYRSVEDDPDIAALAESIKKIGLQEPLRATLDNYIVSGHRRHAALKLIGQLFAPCRVVPRRRDSMTTDEYAALLREHNRQRNKTVAEQVREEGPRRMKVCASNSDMTELRGGSGPT
jgi:ParB-like chromosome segregation protein Spo0J